MQKGSNNGRLLIGVILILVGGLFLMENIFPYDFQLPYWLTDNIFKWYTIFIVIGTAIIFSSHNKVAGGVLITIGIIGMFPEFWPILLIGLGGYIILRKQSKSNFNSNVKFKSRVEGNKHDPDIINDIAIFGGGSKIFQSNGFKGGNLTSIFGGSEIDFRNSDLAEGTNVIDIVAVFGGSSLIVPRDWNVEIDVLPILGGFSDKRIKDPNRVYDDEKRLVVRGVVIFGGGEIKN